MNLSDKISVELEIGTITILLSGLYVHYSGVDVSAIPPSLFIEVSEKLIPYLREWDYDKISFEEWIKQYLVIAPLELFNSSELEELREAEIYFERRLGNVTLIVSGMIP